MDLRIGWLVDWFIIDFLLAFENFLFRIFLFFPKK